MSESLKNERRTSVANSVIEVKDLEKSYKELKALDKVSFEVKKGEILGLLGPNGSGKSTTIGCLLALLKFDGGEVKVFGEEMTPESYEAKRKIGVVFQDVAVYDELTVAENIDYFCGLYVKNRAERKKCVEDVIEFVGLGDFKKFRPKKLSGGLLRRLNIACGIAHRPELIFMDEPTVAVDPQSRNNILEGIKKLNKDGATVVYTSHYMEEVEEICTRIIVMDKGRVIAEGTADELKAGVSIGEKVTVEGEVSRRVVEELKKLKGVVNVEVEDRKVEVVYEKGVSGLSGLVAFLTKNDVKYERIFSELPSLNDVFLELTGKELRDE
ncbi:ABC transporter ATP-binding protein [Candidatus Saccharibacteria bacterium]|nr:ABC transporter ATP-binding protein [Candidatus Saccharibacteria bacterium]